MAISAPESTAAVNPWSIRVSREIGSTIAVWKRSDISQASNLVSLPGRNEARAIRQG